MSRLLVAPIVEGHGEFASVRILLDRVWREVVGGEYVDVVRPIRCSRHKIVRDDEMRRVVGMARNNITHLNPNRDPTLVLILVDADADPPCELAPRLLGSARSHAADLDIACIVANTEYETWFVAAVASLQSYFDLPTDQIAATNPEAVGHGKGWVKRWFRGHYSETVDQPKLTRSMDLSACRRFSPSFDKLCRELEKRLPGTV